MGFSEAILAASTRRYRTVEVPVVGTLRLQSLLRSEVRALRDSFTDDEGRVNARGNKAAELLVANCVVDDNGVRLVSDAAVIDLAFFDGMDDAVFTVLLAACRDHTNWGQQPDWKDVTAAAKN